ncbi:MAG: peptidoglycan DD-metalloendopeptidase family protein [Kangiellaceae bacterium]
MIKQDYKPRNNSNAFKKNAFAKAPVWLLHPFAIIGYALLTLTLTILLFKDSSNPNEESMIESSVELVVEEANLVKSVELESGNIDLELNDAKNEHTAQIDRRNNSHAQSDQPAPSKKNLLNNHVLKSKDEITPPTQSSNINTMYTTPIAIPLELTNSKKSLYDVKRLNSTSNWQSEPVKKNDNLSLIFKRIGLSPQMVYKISTLDKNTKILTNLRPGKSIYYQLDENRDLLALKYVIDMQNTLYVERAIKKDGQNQSKNHEFVSRQVNKAIELRTAYVSGIITDSLFLSGKRAGMSDSLIINFANIFAWDIDFILDIRSGDSFSLLYEEKYIDGEKIGNGDIVAAEFINRGQVLKAIRYTDSKNNSNFYSEEGLSMRKAFLRAPVNFKYISDSFNPRRFHPVQKRIKPHRGIDYAAPVGTPIRAAGDGKVIASGYNRFNGKYVFIQHGNSIVTKYLHLSKRLVSKGKRVKQGQTIGKLGSTGMVTGPHLHYEFVVNGVHRNPRTVKLPKALPISKSEKKKFLVKSQSLVTQLENRKQIQSTPLVAK